MPDSSPPKARPHPAQLGRSAVATPTRGVLTPSGGVGYVELDVTSNFTFLTGASHPDELVERAAMLGHRAIAIADTNTMAGVVRANIAAERHGLPLVVGTRLLLTLSHATPGSPPIELIVYPTDVASYGRLCRLLTLGKRRAGKAECVLHPHDPMDMASGWVGVLVPPPVDACDADRLDAMAGVRDAFDPGAVYLAGRCGYGPDDADRLRHASDLADHLRLPLVATNGVQYHDSSRRRLHDVLACVRLGTTVDAAGFRLEPHAERYLKPPSEMARLFADYPGAVERTVAIAERCAGFRLDQLKYQYPSEVVPDDRSAMQHLAELAEDGADRRFDGGVAGMPDRVRTQFEHELDLIAELGYAHYFLTVEDIVRFARSQGILCQGRGAAANSIVCYCLGVTDADPRKINTLFERFVSRQRDEPPDIDIDFEHQRREEVIQYLYRKYGRDRAALTAEVITYRGRSAVREVGKAMGLSLDTVDRLAKGIDWWHGGPIDADQLRELRLDPNEPALTHLIELTAEIRGFPRHLSQHVGGFVLTEKPLCELVPIENAAMPDRTVIEWDKDDIDAMGMLKVDVLGLGMLSVLRRGYDLIREHHGVDLSVADTPHDDPATYDMIGKADTVGVFQIESRAQMSMLPRLKPRCYYDLVIEVAIVRPGPIQGDMVHPYLRRRDGVEPVAYPDDTVKWLLERTLGVPLFQEQAMQLAIHCAGFTPDQADALRRAVTGFKHVSAIEAFGEKIIDGMAERGYDRAFAERCFRQIKGFSTYGFPESHAASFALLAYASSYLRCHYPAAFTCALLNSQPMGFYAPAQLVQDARRHGVEVRPIDVHHSQWDCSLETCEASPGGTALRLGMNRVRGLDAQNAERIAGAVAAHGRFADLESLWRAAGCSAKALRRLAAADAFNSMGLDRQSATWHARGLKDHDAPLFLQKERDAPEPDRPVPLPAVPELRHVTHDYATAGVSLRPHPMVFLRGWLDRRRVTTAQDLSDPEVCPQGHDVTVAGLCLVRQRPGSAKGIFFITLEDETGVANLVVYPQVFEQHVKVARHANAMLVRGRIDRQGEVVHVKAFRFASLDERLTDLRDVSRNFR
ncbi:MAG: error-prone DNA polymerase [Planctomycetota bacterium]